MPQSLKKPCYCCLTVWGWFLRGQFMTMQPWKCCGVSETSGTRQDGSEEALKRGGTAGICCSHRDRLSGRAAKWPSGQLLRRGNTQQHYTVGHLRFVRPSCTPGFLSCKGEFKRVWEIPLQDAMSLFTMTIEDISSVYVTLLVVEKRLLYLRSHKRPFSNCLRVILPKLQKHKQTKHR